MRKIFFILFYCLALISRAQNPFGFALVPDMIADPSIVFFKGIFYCYATTDGYGKGLNTSGPPIVWKSEDFVHWRFEGNPSYVPSASNQKFWAPSKAVAYGGKYYLYPTVNNSMYAMVSDKPDGPFRLVKGEDRFILPYTEPSLLVPISKGIGGIDAEIFVDDDSSAYVFWNQRHVAKLLSDMASIDTSTLTIIETPTTDYSEGPIFFKRNGIYYYLYTLSGHETYQYRYIYSTKSPLGPFIIPKNDIVAFSDSTTGVLGPGHGCVFQYKNQYYFAFLEFGRRSTNRQVYVNKMNFNEDGTIHQVKVDLNGVGALRKVKYGKPVPFVSIKTSSIRDSLIVEPILNPELKRVEYFYPYFASDRSNGSRWMADKSDSTPWIIADIGKITKINRSEVYFTVPSAGHAYILEGSNDMNKWIVCGGHKELKCQSPHVDQINKQFRYLRIKILMSGHADGCGIWEWNIYK